MGSARLPGKMTMDIGGAPSPTLRLRRLRRTKGPDSIALATSTTPKDDVLALVREIYTRLEPAYGDTFGNRECVTLLPANPELRKLNGHSWENSVR